MNSFPIIPVDGGDVFLNLVWLSVVTGEAETHEVGGIEWAWIVDEKVNQVHECNNGRDRAGGGMVPKGGISDGRLEVKVSLPYKNTKNLRNHQM